MFFLLKETTPNTQPTQLLNLLSKWTPKNSTLLSPQTRPTNSSP